MEISTELIARTLYYVPLSPAKLALQGVSKSFRQALQTPQAHAVTAHVTFPLKDSHPLGTSRKVLRVMSFVCLGPRQRDFSWVAFLDHIQVLACNYEALRPVSPLQTIEELILDCVSTYGGQHDDSLLCTYEKNMSLANLFPNVKRLRLHGIPLEDDMENQESWFSKDIQPMKLQLIVLYDYPCPRAPLLAQNPEWACLKININLAIYGDEWPGTASIPASTAPIITSLTMDTDATLIDLSTFWSCSRLEGLIFRLEEGMDEPVEVECVQSLPKSCCTLQFHNFVPFVHGLSELKGWHCKWGKGQRAISQDGVSPIVVNIPKVDNSPDKYFQLITNTSCPENLI